MERLRQCAELSVGRACGFGLLGTLTFSVGMSVDPLLALRSTAILLSLQSAVLVAMAYRAHRVDFRRREVWLMVRDRLSLPDERAHQIVSGVMHDTFLAWARRIGWPAAACWVVDLAARLVV